MSTHTPTGTTTGTGKHPGRHPVEVGHLVMGVAFLGLAAVWALVTGDVVADDDVRWLMPVPWLAGGLAGLVATALRQRRPRG